MIALCGARLRLFDGPLGAARPSAGDFLRAAADGAGTALAHIFARLSGEGRAALAGVLDALGEAASGGGTLAPLPPPLRKEDLPVSLRHIDLAPLLYLQCSGRLAFQSQLLRNVWPMVRAEYVGRRRASLRGTAEI